MNDLYYLFFSVNKIPDLTLTKYSVFDGSSVEDIMDKHGIFLRQLYRLGYTAGVYFHLLYNYNPDPSILKGQHLTILFYATAKDPAKLNGIREFLTTSVLSTYYDFFCYEIAKKFSVYEETYSDGTSDTVLEMVNISGTTVQYSIDKNDIPIITDAEKAIKDGKKTHIVCEIASDANAVLSVDELSLDLFGRIQSDRRFSYGAFLTKKDYCIPAQNRLDTDGVGETMLYSIMEWEPAENGRLYNVLKLMEGYDRDAVLRIDIFPVEHTQAIRQRLPYAETRRRISDHRQGKDDNSENIIKSWDKYLNNLMKFPQFLVNVAAFSDTQDTAIMLVDSVAAEAVESGTYLIESMYRKDGFDMYESDAAILHVPKEEGNYVAPFLSLYTLEEIRPMFSFPILYPGESIECPKETDPVLLPRECTIDPQTHEMHESMLLGVSQLGYDVTFPLKLFKKHAFIAGVPGAGKTNTMLYLVTSLWRDTNQHVPFLVLEPAKQEYRALAMIGGMEKLRVFSPGADTYFPLHINPFEFPVGLTLAEHIANLMQVFAGAFELIPPSPFLIDSCIEKVYLNKGWNINERNDGSKPYPTMQELYDSLKIAVEESGYEGEVQANIRSVMEVRIGSLLRREIGHVYNVRYSSMRPEEWLENPVIIELESLGEGPANFMSLLISTLIREVLKIRKTSGQSQESGLSLKREINHVIFYEEAHNLIGPTTDDPVGGSVDPKISATKYLVKMLAEVRALGEGIVIADQLPTAMAPEVLKNTGLKLGHRITAQDDRGLLGSTMSASADQLEEQGTFETGQALIFYEGLLKPFKMRLCEWEKNLPKNKYDSPSNQQLFEHLRHNETYKELMRRSAAIMQEKMTTEFELLRQKAKSRNETIRNRNREKKRLQEDIRCLQGGGRGTFKDSLSLQEQQQHIATLQNNCSNIEREWSENGSSYRDLARICWEYNNLYYAYITLSKNYDDLSPKMYLCTIKNYLSLFEHFGPLTAFPALCSVLIGQTEKVIRCIREFVNYDGTEGKALLEGCEDYESVFPPFTIYFANRMAWECKNLFDSLSSYDEKSLETYSKTFAVLYSKYLTLAQQHFAVFEREKAKNHILPAFYKKQYLLYKTIVSEVIDFYKVLKKIDPQQYAVIFKNTQEVMTSFRSIVDYYDKKTPTILSDWKEYGTVWDGTDFLLEAEIDSRFMFVRQELKKAVQDFQQNPSAQNVRTFFRESCQFGSLIFQLFRTGITDRPDTVKKKLFHYYIQHILEAAEAGREAYPIICNSVLSEWRHCLDLMAEWHRRTAPDPATEAYYQDAVKKIDAIIQQGHEDKP